MRKIIFTAPDGRLCVVHPVINTHPRPENITEAQAEQRAWDKLPPDAINPQFVDEAAIPSDRTFRNAWTHGGTAVTIDMPKAREIHRNKLRELRASKLAALDVAYDKADEIGDLSAKKIIAAQKQALRDVTKDTRIDSSATPDELKAIIPASLTP